MDTISRGLVAGAAGTTALNALTYLDMVIRSRPASTTPEQTVRRLAEVTGVDLGDGDNDGARNRREGLGALLGYATGLAVGVGYAVFARDRVPGVWGAVTLAAAAMLLSNGPMTVLRVTDPRDWSAQDWAADVVPHLAYGAVAAAALRLLTDDESVRVTVRSEP